MPLFPFFSRPASKTPWASSGNVNAPSDGERAAGYADSARPGSRRFNFLLNELASGMRYFMQRGLSEWKNDDSFPQYAVLVDPADGNVYRAIGTPVDGTAPHLDPTNWQTLIPPSPPQFGTAADGVHTVTGAEALLLQAKNYSTLTVNSGGVLQSLNSVIRAQTLWVKTGGKIHCNGNPGTTAFGGAGIGNDCARQDYSAFGGLGMPFAPLIGGGMGGIMGHTGTELRADWFNGTTDLATIQTSRIFTSVPVQHAPAAGTDVGANGSADGGKGGGTNGAAPGNTTFGGSAGVNYCPDEIASWLATPGFYFARLAGGQYPGNSNNTSGYPLDVMPYIFQWHGGAGGSSGAFDVDGHQGYAGAGGGIVCIFAYNLRIDDLNAITALGGAGSAANTGNAGGGGGGGGGRVVIFYRNFTGTTPTLACVNGGAGGAGIGTGPAGASGSQGKLLFVRI